MKPLRLDDLLPLGEYVNRRAEFFAANARYLDRYRRVRIGPSLTVVFENRQTLWFRIQELLRVARLTDPTRVQRELDLYNRLLPGHNSLQAALFIDVPEGPDWSKQCDFWRDLSGESIQLQIGNTHAPARLVTCRPEDRCAGTTHWIEFAIHSDVRRALGDPRSEAVLSAEHHSYQHRSTPVSGHVRQSLLDDLELSDRDVAA